MVKLKTLSRHFECKNGARFIYRGASGNGVHIDESSMTTLVGLKDFRITLITSNKAVSLKLKNPRQQSG